MVAYIKKSKHGSVWPWLWLHHRGSSIPSFNRAGTL